MCQELLSILQLVIDETFMEAATEKVRMCFAMTFSWAEINILPFSVGKHICEI